jgi:hypothetical protein
MGASFVEHFVTRGTAQQTVGTSEVSLPAAPAKLVNVKASQANDNNVFIGLPGVLVTTGFELDAGEETGWLPVGDVSDLSVIGGAAAQEVSIIWLT